MNVFRAITQELPPPIKRRVIQLLYLVYIISYDIHRYKTVHSVTHDQNKKWNPGYNINELQNMLKNRALISISIRGTVRPRVPSKSFIWIPGTFYSYYFDQAYFYQVCLLCWPCVTLYMVQKIEELFLLVFFFRFYLPTQSSITEEKLHLCRNKFTTTTWNSFQSPPRETH